MLSVNNNDLLAVSSAIDYTLAQYESDCRSGDTTRGEYDRLRLHLGRVNKIIMQLAREASPTDGQYAILVVREDNYRHLWHLLKTHLDTLLEMGSQKVLDAHRTTLKLSITEQNQATLPDTVNRTLRYSLLMHAAMAEEENVL